jgi:ABC-type sugar transport system substrate-binding protein
MQKRILLSIVLLIAFVLTGCQPAQPAEVTQEAAPEAAATEAAAPVEKVQMAFFVPTMSDTWYVGALEGAKRRAAEKNVDLQMFDANNKVETQLQQVDTVIATGVDAIILSSVDPHAMVPSIERAKDAGIKVVVYDRPIFESTKVDALLVLDTPNMGIQAAEAIAAQLTQKHGEPKGKVIRVYGDLADTWVTYITEGWDPTMAKYPDIEILTANSGVWEVETAATNVAQLMATNSNIDAIFVDSDWLATGIIANLEASGEYGKAGEDTHIYFVGVNGSPEALDYIREGWMDATISTPVPDLTGAAVDIALMLTQGKPVPSEYVQAGAAWSPAKIYPSPVYGTAPFPLEEKVYKGPVLNMLNELVTKENVEDALLWGNIVGK